jgi:hypothetical protein
MGLALTLGMRLFRSGLQHVLGLALGLGLGLVVLSPTVSASGLLPSLSLASPGDGSNVSGNVTFVAVADGDGLTSLQFRVDGGDYGSAITAGSCRTTFDTRTAADGPHTIQAVGFDGSGNSVASYPATIFVNNLAPAISDIWLANLTTSSVTVGWSTATLADGQVEFGSTSAYGNASARDYAATTNHAQDLTGLSAGTTYHFRVLSVGQNGVLSVSGNYVFATAAAAAPPPPSNPGNPTPTPTPTPTPGPTPTPTPTPAPTPGPTPGGPTPTPSPTPVAPVTPTPFPTPAPSPTPSPVPPPSGSLGTRTSTGTALPTIRRKPPQFALTPEPGAVIPSTVGDTQVQARVSSGSTSATAAARARASSTAKTTTKSTTSQLTAPSASPAPPPTTTAPQATTGKSRATVVVVAVPCSEPDPFAAKGGVGLCVAGKWVELWKGSGVAARRGK